MLYGLLISSQATMGIVIAALCIFAVALVLYGVFRRFTMMGWLPWQILVIFLVMMAAGTMPQMLAPDVRFWLFLVIFMLTTAFVIGIGDATRHYMLSRERPASPFIRVCNRILGGVTGVLGLAVVIGALAGLALPICQYAIPSLGEALGSVFSSSAYTAISGYLMDFFLVTFLVTAIHAGYRVGVGRGILTVVMCVLTLLALVLAVLFAVAIPGLSDLGKAIGELIPGNSTIGMLAGYGAAILIWFVIFFILFALLGFFINKLIRRMRHFRPLGILGGLLMALVFFLIAFILVLGFNGAVYFLAERGLGDSIPNPEMLSGIMQYVKGIADAFTSSPFAKAIYENLGSLIP